MDIVFQFRWRFRFPVGFRLSVQFSTVLVHLVATGRVSLSSGISSVWPIRNESSLLNCIAAVPTVFCVCNAWFWVN